MNRMPFGRRKPAHPDGCGAQVRSRGQCKPCFDDVIVNHTIVKRRILTWPEFCVLPHSIRLAAISKSVWSASTKTGDLPPSSRETGVRFLAAAAATMRPTRGLPVRKMWSHWSSSI